MKLALPLIIVLFTSFLITFSANTVAQGSSSATKRGNQQVLVKSTNQAAQMAQGRYGGKVLKVQSQKSGYRVKLIKKNGHIISVFVNANSGQISGQ